MPYNICLIPGDGIGLEVIPAARKVLDSMRLDLCFSRAEAGWATFERLGTALPEDTVQAVENSDACLFGAVSSPLSPVEGYSSPIVGLRRRLNLYANLRPVVSQPLEDSRADIDMLVLRENSEGLYGGAETRSDDRATTERLVTRVASERIVELAFREASSRRGRVTIVHKANVLRATCGLFREVAFEVAARYPEIEAEEMLVDATAMRLITEPQRFDVIVTTNLFGDILSDEAAALVGGLGLAPSGNVGVSSAVFEPVHGSAPDIAGTGMANPCASLYASAMMLAYLGEQQAADRLDTAVSAVLQNGPRTPDLGGEATTDQVTNAVIRALEEI